MTMTGTKWSTAAASGTRKAIAVVAAGALVASLSYFHLWGNTPAIAASDAGQVEVQFKIEVPDATVTVNGRSFAAGNEERYAAAIDADLAFSIDSGDPAASVAVSYATEGGFAQTATAMGTKQPSDNLIIGESSYTDDSHDSSYAEGEEDPVESGEETGESMIYAETSAGSIPETAAVLQEAIDDEEVALAAADTAQPSDEETLEDEFPPMAAAPANEDVATESVTVKADENGTYTIPMAVLSAAADRGAVVVVTVVPEDGATSWSEVADILQNGNDGAVRLAADITEGVGSVTVSGNKVIDLNGHDITAEKLQSSLFIVRKGASLTITDTSEGAAAKELEVSDSDLNGKKIPNPAEDRAGFEEMVGKAATYNAEDKTLQYFVTESYTDRPAKGQTEEYLFEYKLDLSGAGAIEISEGQRLVDLTGGTLNIEGGRLTLESGWYAVCAQESSTVNMSGGFLVGSTGEGGAAIYAADSTVNIAGDAILAGNTASGDNNGGAVWVYNTTLNIGGNAILAGNRAGTEVYDTIDFGTMATERNGGAVYVEASSDVTVNGNAIIAGNTAQADGGGIYLMGRLKTSSQKKSTLTLSGAAYITNNRSMNDKSAIHFTERTHQSSEVNWKRYGGGGGGIFSMDETSINGAQLTGNYASDGGGAMLITSYATYSASGSWLSQYVYPLLKVENAVFASNYAGTSEGGAINAITHKDSYIKRGYITNNMTATDFDYGGGGLFLSSATHGTETGLTVIYPLVAKNTARGFGGGVGVCTNGIAVTADAAIFDNTALTDNATTNPNEFGDQWAYDEKYGLKELAQRKEVDGVMQSLADDFFCAKESVVYNKMLGDENSYYNWTGATNGYVLPGSIVAVRKGAETSANTLSIDGVFQPSPPNALFNIKESIADLHIYDGDAEARDFNGYGVTVQVSNISNPTFPVGTYFGVVTETNRIGLSYPLGTAGASKYPGFYSYMLSVDTDARSNLIQTGTLKGAYTKVDGSGAADYPMYEVANMAQTEGSFAQGDRLMFLKANPSDEAKASATAKAVLFITGNYSNTNGGGIACNDRIAIGRDVENPDIPDEPEPSDDPDLLGALQINKSIDTFSAENGTATALFKVTGYVDSNAAKNEISDLVIYENTAGITFGTGESKNASKLLEGLPAGWYVVEEQYYSGDNFAYTPNRAVVEVKGVAEGEEAEIPVTEVSFQNTYTAESFGTGVVNSYKFGDDGELTYTPDANYNNRKQPSAPIEGGN